MKKRIGAALLGLSLIPINCFGAVNVLNDEYKTSVSTVTVTERPKRVIRSDSA